MIKDLTLKDMNRTGGSGHGSGCELINCSGSIQGCIFEKNSGRYGGGFWLSIPEYKTVTIKDNTFNENSSNYEGCGFYVDSDFTGDISDNIFNENSASAGGGFYVSGNFTGNISNNIFSENSLSSYRGGGFCLLKKLTGKINANYFIKNSANYGAGFYLAHEGGKTNDAIISNNVFYRNTINWSKLNGAGFYSKQNVTVINNTFYGGEQDESCVNIYNTASDSVFKNNIFDNLHTAIWEEGELNLTITHNNFYNVTDILHRNSNPMGNDLPFIELFLTGFRNNSDWNPGTVGEDNIAETYDHHLTKNSQNINAGTIAIIPIVDDFEGDIRPQSGFFDIGADEYFDPNKESPGRLILIAGGGAAETNTLWSATEELATSAYRIFYFRGFRDTDIYFMSPVKWNDFNGDGIDDHVVDCPPESNDRNLVVDDVHEAITKWAVENHTPGTPLYIWLIDHGYPDDSEHGPYFMVAPGQLLFAGDLNQMFNTYEEATDGQVILVNESCYSGQFLESLKKQGRIIITATKDNIVNYDNNGANSFTHHLLKNLFENKSLQRAFDKGVESLRKQSLTYSQTPQLDDNGDGKYDDTDGITASYIKLGGDFFMGVPWPEIISVTPGKLIETTASFTVTTNANMKRVWASVQPPGYKPDTSGDYQKIDLEKFDLDDENDDLAYEGAYDGFNQTGAFVITFYAKDQFGNTAISEPLEFTGTGKTAPGDISNDGVVNLADAVLALKIITESNESDQITMDADIGGNNKIGLEEAIYVLQVLGELRESS